MYVETGSQQSVIFINYRRTDAGWPASLIATKLGSTFGEHRVFQDVRGIDAGDDFAAAIDDNLRRAAVVIVLIGKDWLAVHDKFWRRRLDNEQDWVRREIRTALENRDCTVIPVLIDGAELPDQPDALPSDIGRLLTLHHVSLRQAESDDDIERLRKAVERAGLERISNPGAAAEPITYNDKDVNEVAARIRRLRERRGVEFVGGRELFIELDQLFNRKTFRFETLRGCPEQRWADRLDSAYQTLSVLRDSMRNVRETAPEKYAIYLMVVMEVEKYCMQMGTLLFDPPVDYSMIENHIGKGTFKAALPSAIRFPAGADKQPEIPDAINDQIDPHRARAVEFMDKLTAN